MFTEVKTTEGLGYCFSSKARPRFGLSTVLPVTGGRRHPEAGQRWALRPL